MKYYYAFHTFIRSSPFPHTHTLTRLRERT